MNRRTTGVGFTLVAPIPLCAPTVPAFAEIRRHQLSFNSNVDNNMGTCDQQWAIVGPLEVR